MNIIIHFSLHHFTLYTLLTDILVSANIFTNFILRPHLTYQDPPSSHFPQCESGKTSLDYTRKQKSIASSSSLSSSSSPPFLYNIASMTHSGRHLLGRGGGQFFRDSSAGGEYQPGCVWEHRSCLDISAFHHDNFFIIVLITPKVFFKMFNDPYYIFPHS